VSDQSYYPLLKDTFNRLGIGYYLPGDLSLAQTRSGRGLLLFLELIDSGFERSSVLELVSYAPFDFNRLLNTPLPVSPALWEQLALEAKVTRGQEQWLTALKRLSSRLLTQERETGESASDKLNSLDSFIRFLARLFTEAAGFTSLDRWSSFAAACLQFLDSFFVYDPEQEPLRQCLKQLGQLEVCREKVAFIQARQMLRQALQTIQIPAGSFQRSGVNILPLSAASGIRFKTVFIPGLVEKSFPAIPPPDPLLPEQERVALQGVLPLRHEQLQRESLAFALAVNSATEALVLSWPRLDIKSSREYFPSLFVFEAGRALTGIRPPLDQLPALPGFTHVSAELHPGGPEQALSVEEYDLACCASLVSPARPSDYLRKLDPLLQRAVRLENARQSAKLTPYQGVLTGSGSGLTKSISRFKSSVSATALEEYATCPYLFYLKRLLKIKPTPEIEEMVPLNPLQRGKLVHRILELFYRELLSRVMDSPGYPEYSGDLLNRISDEQFARLEKSGEVNTGLLWEIERGRLRFLLQEYLTWELTHAGPLSPYRFEASFGMGFPDDGGELSADSIKRPAVSLSLGSEETLYFRGRIDRVDRGNRGLRIIDYKTGRKRIKKDHSLEGGTALQLPVYLLASRSLFGEEDIQWMEACYIHLTPGKVETVTFDGEPWDQVKAQLVSVVEILYRGISRGLFFPFPEGREGNCRYCDYRAICGPEVEQVFARKLADPLMSEFLKLRDPAVEGS
ncbi:MAG TPA: hypothetical protein GX693_06130, partial [Firmicutes bacterium]|nr:hypothetical protein [Bacillota bacterium]